MRSPAPDGLPLHLSTKALPARDRIPQWREVVGQLMLRVDIQPLSNQPFHADVTLRALPGLRTMSYVGCAFRMQRTREIVAQSDDAFGMVVNLDGTATVSQCGREAALRVGDAAPITNMELATYAHLGSRHIGLVVPRAALAPLVADVEAAAARLIPHSNEALQLLVSYLQAAHCALTLASPELLRLTVTHVHDLFALAIGATRDGAAWAERRGMRAARLRAIKADILQTLDHDTLTVADVAARQHVTPRYVQRLFETEGTTFSEFLLDQRLARSRRMLIDPRYGGRTITAIAFDAGFGDLSYFNRTFRRRYGATPSDVRNATEGNGA